jgi:hypothetical protein
VSQDRLLFGVSQNSLDSVSRKFICQLISQGQEEMYVSAEDGLIDVSVWIIAENAAAGSFRRRQNPAGYLDSGLALTAGSVRQYEGQRPGATQPPMNQQFVPRMRDG